MTLMFFIALGAKVIEGDGSWVSFIINDEKGDFHRPHPGKEAKREPNKPFSGKFMIRIDSALHGEIAGAAAHTKKSLNKWVTDTLTQATHA